MYRNPILTLLALTAVATTVVSIDGRPTVPDARPTMTFAQDGTVSGSAGCRSMAADGRLRLDGAVPMIFAPS